MTQKLLDYLSATLLEWPIAISTVGWSRMQLIQDQHGRLVFISLYPEEPEIVTYNMWEKHKKYHNLLKDLRELNQTYNWLDEEGLLKISKELAELNYEKTN